MSEDIFARRTQLLRDFQVPMRQEAVAFLGEALTDVVLHTMTPKAQELMGVTKPLSTPPEVLWISPEDRLRNELVLKAPRNVEHLQAFTHQTIMRLGEGIEKKVENEQISQTKAAVDEAKMFEQFECQNRIQFALDNERKAQIAAREQERMELLTLFQEERDQLLVFHSEALDVLRSKMNKQCEIDMAARVSQAETEANLRSLELEIKWKLQEVLLNVFIEDAQKRLEDAVGETRKDFIQIFKRLFESFVAEIEETRNDLHCTQIAELMHVVCVERTEALQMVSLNQNAFQKSIDKLRHQLDEHESPRFEQRNHPNQCLMTDKYKRLFIDILDQYSQFIENTLKEAPGQGRFLLPSPQIIQQQLENNDNNKTLLELLFAPSEPATNPKRDVREYAFLPIAPCSKECPKPILIGSCMLEPEPSISEPEPELAPTSSSLSCFDFDNQLYASNKHYDEIVNRMQLNHESIPQAIFSAHDVHDDDSSSTTSSYKKRIDKIAQVVEKVVENLSDPQVLPEDRIRIAKQHLTHYLHRACQNTSFAESNRSAKLFPSKLLSVADSLDLIPHDHHVSKSQEMENTMVQIRGTQLNSNCSSSFLPCETQNRASEKSVKIKLRSSSKSKHDTPTVEEIDKHHLVALQLQSDEYIRSLQKEPPYMRPTSKAPLQHLSLWKYKVTTPEEWKALFNKVEKAVNDNRLEKRVRVDDAESLVLASVPESSLASDSHSTINRTTMKSILRRVDETPQEPSGYDRFKVATLLERMERGSGVVDTMTRKFSLN